MYDLNTRSQMEIVTDCQYKDFKFLSNRNADHKEVLIQIYSVHRKFLRVTKTHDYERLES